MTIKQILSKYNKAHVAQVRATTKLCEALQPLVGRELEFRDWANETRTGTVESATGCLLLVRRADGTVDRVLPTDVIVPRGTIKSRTQEP